MRVLRVSHSAVVTAWRGRESALRARGLTVRTLSARTWAEGGRDVDLEPQPGEDVVGVRTVGRHPNVFLYDPRPIWRALGEDWDVLDLHEEPAALATAEVLLLRALRRSRVPYVLYSAQNIAKRYPAPFRWWERRALRGAGAVSVCNAEAGDVLRAKGLTAPAHVIGLGVEPPGARDAVAGHPGAQDAGSRTRGARDEGAPTDAGVVGAAAPARTGYVGRLLHPHKGLDVLLDAAEAEPRITVAVAGAGPHEAALRARAATPALAGRVTFHGHVSGDALDAFYRGLDVLAVPSVPTPGWLEQFGRVAVEAMAAGVPVVASDSGALRDVVGGAGTLVPPGDAGALAAALVAVVDDAGLAARMRATGAERAAEYTWAAIAERYEAMYRQVVAGGGPGGGAAAGDAGDPEVVVVAYHAAGLLGRALTPLAGALPVTVVDNSGDPEVRRVAEDAGARYLDPGANLGFAAAVNLGVRAARPGADVLLLNPDARVDLDGVRALHRALRAEPGLAAVGPAQVDDDGTPARVRWPFPTPAAAWRQAVGLGVPETREGFVIGSVLLLRRTALAAVGGFDERFFLYSEETDWQRRAHDAGWRSAVVEDVLAGHVGGGTSTDPTRRETHFHASQERYFRTHHGAAGWASARAAVVLGAVPRALLPGDRGEAARLRLRLYLRGPLRAEAALGDPRAPRPAPGTPAPGTPAPGAPAPAVDPQAEPSPAPPATRTDAPAPETTDREAAA
ncbi:glycosyltransferase [Cellulosimicrobium cellulans]|uniref:glycosyltransferase n=1 Tax=Cellulosimicrobium cellulans TaxID=1710 RepID=UPI0021CB958C|nr:glycosyltransferase [Cellulosimicrobium cellulans]